MLFIADFFVEDVNGGGELCSEEIINHLQKNRRKIVKLHSHKVTSVHIKNHSGEPIIISNFVRLPEEIKNLLSSGGFHYFIIEHDHKYCRARNPLAYSGMIVPEQDLLHRDFYANAQAVFCQSASHAKLLEQNLWIDNVINLGTNLWSDKDLDCLEKRLNTVKTRSYGIMQSPNPIKGTRQAVELCKSKNLAFDLIPPLPQEQFWDELAKTDTIVFLPQTFETYSRFAIEAKILGCKLVSNKAIGAMSEPYWNQSGKELLETIKVNKLMVLENIEATIETYSTKPYRSHLKPMVSLITTVYKGEKHMKGFLDAFVGQHNCENHELIIIDANSPENENEIIKPYLEKHSNIVYQKIDQKKTTMECFNIATDKAKGEYIALCMVDDRIAPFHLDHLSKHLFLRPDVDLVYGDAAVVSEANAEWAHSFNKEIRLLDHSQNPFSNEGMIKNLPGPFPMYRKSLHYKIDGYRKEILHGGDWEFYLRAVQKGSRFLKIDILAGLYYNNPDGLSTTRDHAVEKERRGTEQMIFEEYKDVFGPKVYQQFKPYFDQWKLK